MDKFLTSIFNGGLIHAWWLKGYRSKELQKSKREAGKIFENSRNKWKDKCRDSKYELKLLKNRNRYLKKRKDELSKKVKQLEKQLGQYEQKKKHWD